VRDRSRGGQSGAAALDEGPPGQRHPTDRTGHSKILLDRR
jgi:hypothetical protein